VGEVEGLQHEINHFITVLLIFEGAPKSRGKLEGFKNSCSRLMEVTLLNVSSSEWGSWKIFVGRPRYK
jgi:hypothetical protein